MQLIREREKKMAPVQKSHATFFYNLAYAVFAVAYLPVFLKKIKQESRPGQLWRERLGFLPPPEKSQCATVWIHAVSVGEVMAIQKFVVELLTRCQELDVVLTTVTPTGQKIARQMQQERLRVFYFPFDFSFACRRFFRTLRPQCLLLAETEIWPNLLIQARQFGVPVGILNARLSRKSAGRYRALGFLFKDFFRHLDFVLAQTAEDAARFINCGLPSERVSVLGNMKFDNVVLNERESEKSTLAALKKEWGIGTEDRIWIAGSTHPGEEEMITRVFSRVRLQHPQLRLIFAPRHVERAPGLVRQLSASGLRIGLVANRHSEKWDVLVLDQMGILKNLYQIADVVFMGGSWIRHGGQNPIEPAGFKKPVLHGPYVFNFEKIYQILDQEGGSIQVEHETELAETLEMLLKDEPRREALGQKAFFLVKQLQGATERYLDWVLHFFAISPVLRQY